MGGRGSLVIMKRVRTGVVVAGAGLVALTLTACEQPNPGASVFSGTTSQFQRAACWAFDSDEIDADACAKDVAQDATDGAQVPTIPVVPGQTIGISVDPVVADAGWVPRVNGQPLTPSPITSTYFRFTFPEFQEVGPDGILMELVAGQQDKTRGLWLYKLVAR